MSLYRTFSTLITVDISHWKEKKQRFGSSHFLKSQKHFHSTSTAYHVEMTPTPTPNDDVSVNVSYTANGNNENDISVDAVCVKEHVWNSFIQWCFYVQYLTDEDFKGSLWSFSFFFPPYPVFSLHFWLRLEGPCVVYLVHGRLLNAIHFPVNGFTFIFRSTGGGNLPRNTAIQE